MSVTDKSIAAINNEMQKISIAEQRIKELPVELNQLLNASRVLQSEHNFDRDTSYFQHVLNKVKD